MASREDRPPLGRRVCPAPREHTRRSSIAYGVNAEWMDFWIANRLNVFMSNVIVWDLETVPDLKGFAAANGHVGEADDEIRAAMGDKFPKHIYHSIICIGALVAHQVNIGVSNSTTTPTKKTPK